MAEHHILHQASSSALVGLSYSGWAILGKVYLLTSTSFSLTNQSLYTSFQPTRCFFYSAWENSLARIDTNYGLDNLGSAATPAQFWDALRVWLVTRALEFAETLRYGYAMTILTAGEAANHPGFLDVVRDVARELTQGRRTRNGEMRKHRTDVVVSEEPTFAAARGSAFWLRTRIDWSYCEGVGEELDGEGEDEGENLSHDHSDRDRHTELK